MGRLTVEQIVSVDGYAAEPDGGMRFAEAAEAGNPNDADQLAFIQDVDAILLGANTYRMFAGYWPTADPDVEIVAEPINRLPKFVVSNTLADAPWGDTGAVEILRGDAIESITALTARFDHVIVWGSLTLADALFEANLVDTLRLRVVPTLIGAGRSFTPAALSERRLELERAVPMESGHVGLTYRLR
ncbi:dihydrofolate reductase family protein [Agromyces aerolatus]|uniref:dihydrofolate reductase family protein n=1 Tax=Agromyces sp. LY-1074 TaxID=3074080 RepID=UPI002854F3B0|nr:MULTISPECIES: dihydrofolate reductase family protein [unclassified Agromyces]MDR5701119.1 dihydrofolate reductase family protein [Agromyces sp. LY-1074]MDR5707759.1 dihydrofolate reductase family protein [Agromyces sp. LY-1358]